jgi:hypothetical protein
VTKGSHFFWTKPLAQSLQFGRFSPILYFFFFSAFGFVSSNAQGKVKDMDPDCIRWLEQNKIKSGTKSCAEECLQLKVDMGTFQCNGLCKELCNHNIWQIKLQAWIYPAAMTAAERKLILTYPKDALKAFISKEKAEFSQSRNFPNGKYNDEGDAFRHFVWAGLMTNELGADRAKEFLDAHEESNSQHISEKSMDLANNRAGILATEKLKKSNSFNQTNLELEALNELRDGHLIVLSPGLEIPKEPR